MDLVTDMLRHGMVSVCERSGTNECINKYCAQSPEAERHPEIQSKS